MISNFIGINILHIAFQKFNFYNYTTIMENKNDMSIDEEEQINEITTDISITPHEQQIFDTLLEVAQMNNLKTIIRVNGGWVRDKMLHKDSKDIDFSLDDIYGAEFAEMLSKHLYPGQENKYGVIKSNSEKSKHLETATLKVHGTFIDLVNLRSEEYAEGSRVPTIRIGTPLEDALRRDLTINAMFYNINEQKIEDLTEKGIDDLKVSNYSVLDVGLIGKYSMELSELQWSLSRLSWMIP